MIFERACRLERGMSLFNQKRSISISFNNPTVSDGVINVLQVKQDRRVCFQKIDFELTKHISSTQVVRQVVLPFMHAWCVELFTLTAGRDCKPLHSGSFYACKQKQWWFWEGGRWESFSLTGRSETALKVSLNKTPDPFLTVTHIGFSNI